MNENISNVACFEAHNKKNKCCNISKCRYWHDLKSSNNCIINKVNNNDINDNEMTLQEIGDLFNITRMRVCQIEKSTLNKMKKSIEKSLA
jgi:DNA-directed RNA polymerase sigma subunit (sigma70/sigma32)